MQSNGFGDNRVYCLYEDRKGTIWAGSGGSGLFYFNEGTRQFDLLSEEDKPNYISRTSYISSIIEDSDGTLWVATMYGLFALEQTSNHSYTYQCYRHTNPPGSISSSSVQTLYEDGLRNLWIGTTDNGLNVKPLGTSAFNVFQKKDGLASNTIRAILTDAAGNLWISGNMGLTKYDPHSGKFTNYNRDDGLESNNFYANACLRSTTGELFFGNNNGFNAFYPDSIRNSTIKPVVYLTDLKINNQSVGIGTPESPLTKHISLTSDIKLSYDQRSFAIDFVAINYEHSFRPQYCYKLEGFDKSWNCIGSNHQAIYTTVELPDTMYFWQKHRIGMAYGVKLRPVWK